MKFTVNDEPPINYTEKFCMAIVAVFVLSTIGVLMAIFLIKISGYDKPSNEPPYWYKERDKDVTPD